MYNLFYFFEKNNNDLKLFTLCVKTKDKCVTHDMMDKYLLKI